MPQFLPEQPSGGHGKVRILLPDPVGLRRQAVLLHSTLQKLIDSYRGKMEVLTQGKSQLKQIKVVFKIFPNLIDPPFKEYI